MFFIRHRNCVRSWRVDPLMKHSDKHWWCTGTLKTSGSFPVLCLWRIWHFVLMFTSHTGRNQLSWAETPTEAENRQVEVWESGEQLFLLTNLLFDLTILSRDPPTQQAEHNKLKAAPLKSQNYFQYFGRKLKWDQVEQVRLNSSLSTVLSKSLDPALVSLYFASTQPEFLVIF